jgi:hypothetical protein
MNEQYIKKMIEKTKREFAVERYGDIDINISHRSFIGVPRKHLNDSKTLILMSDPFNKNREFYEFTVDSIDRMEEIGTITNEAGQSAIKVRIWVKKGVPAIKARPFIVK